MSTLFVPQSDMKRGYSFGTDKSRPHELNGSGISHQGDAGWGVSRTDRWDEDRGGARKGRRHAV